eukprot:6204811-Pleurochrysis_carterae.AAC.1
MPAAKKGPREKQTCSYTATWVVLCAAAPFEKSLVYREAILFDEKRAEKPLVVHHMIGCLGTCIRFARSLVVVQPVNVPVIAEDTDHPACICPEPVQHELQASYAYIILLDFATRNMKARRLRHLNILQIAARHAKAARCGRPNGAVAADARVKSRGRSFNRIERTPQLWAGAFKTTFLSSITENSALSGRTMSTVYSTRGSDRVLLFVCDVALPRRGVP